VSFLGGRAAKYTPHPGGFPERRLADVPLVMPAAMREVQKLAQEEYFLDILQISENAGMAAARLALAMLGGQARGQQIVVLAGGGNMGGAGLAAARNLMNWGFLVEPVFAEVEGEFSSFSARRQKQILRTAIMMDDDREATSESTMERHLHSADLIIDAIAGYGLEGPATGIGAALVHLVHDAGRPVLALDIPTGMSATTGERYEPAIQAATTLALDLPKAGLATPAGRAASGEIYLADLGVPRGVYDRVGIRVGATFSEGPLVHLRR
jgi:NAD(P)H-hydrate epimerase